MKVEMSKLSKSGFWKVQCGGRISYHATEAGALEQVKEFEKDCREKYIEQQRNVAFGQR